ncbi:MAG: CHAT domain-containing protein, partial [Chitinophagaceae bacterium]|nr:CHAT domain-containing protein [Chitinophagaceae bacterium]
EVISRLEKGFTADTLLFQSWLKKGILLDVKSNYPEAKNAYLAALSVHKKNTNWSDSLLFTVSLYTGSVYYHLNQFDSANYYLAKAEDLSKVWPGVPEKERLYNVWGAMFYESGNYRQSGNFFSQALEIVKNKVPYDKISAINFENNIAASYYRQEQYEKSLTIYNRLLKQGLFTNQIWLNMGKSHLAMGNYHTALQCFQKVKSQDVPGVDNEIAQVQLLLNDTKAASLALERFADRNDIRNNKSVDAGIYFLYKAKLQSKLNQFTDALASLQESIIVFSGNFRNKDIYSNPFGFTGSFASYKLFEALNLKAAVFQELYNNDQQEINLQASLATYQTAISLLRYIEKSYDTDDARLLLKKNSRMVYDAAFAVCMHLNKLHPGGPFLEQAFLVAEKSKASVISQQLKEHQFKQTRGIAPALLQKERELKYHIARLNIRIDQGNDGEPVEGLVKEKMNFEIELAKLQQEIEKNNGYYKLKYEESYPGAEQIRASLGPDQALISLYAGPNSLYAFVVSNNSFRYVQIDSLQEVKQWIENWTSALQSTSPGKRFREEGTGQQLFRRLILPVRALTGGRKEWIIIPDDVLHFLPFESLPENDGSPLLASTTISYHFSSQFVVPPTAKQKDPRAYSVLSMAPFSQSGLPMPDHSVLFALPSSLNEIEGLPGQSLVDKEATKQHFLEDINRFPILHFVTHAIADKNNSGRSFLAFYPDHNSVDENRLYAEELYGLDMDSTELVILSACETGNGQLVNGEGVMSVSRGFAYAGCQSIINSLWKADDKASSFILKHFHQYLRKGYSRTRSLQLAKLDFINSDALHKAPGYWANFVLIGNTDPLVSSSAISLSWPIFVG